MNIDDIINMAVKAKLGRKLKPIGLDTGDVFYTDATYRTEELEAFATLLKAAHLEELAGVEMPEPAMKKGSYGYRMAHVNYYTEDQCQQAVAAAVAAAVARKEIEFRTDLQEVVSGAEQTETKFEAELAKKDEEIAALKRLMALST